MAEPRAFEDPLGSLEKLHGGMGSFDIEVCLRVREEARSRREFRLADAIRNQLLQERGLRVEDRLGGLSVCCPAGPSPEQRAQAAAAAEAKGAESRAVARKALQASLLADSRDEAERIARETEEEVLRLLTSPCALGANALPGRQHADLALTLALSGCDKSELFQLLGDGATAEIQRTGHHTPPLATAQMAERLAAAGYRQQDEREMFSAVRALLQRLDFLDSSPTLEDLTSGNFSLHSDRPLLWLFRHALRQGRRSVPPDHCQQLKAALRDLNDAAPAQPLIIDLGCGFAVSSLGLAVLSAPQSVLAVDASAHCVGFANGLARRWGIQPQRLRVEHCGAIEALQGVRRQFVGEVEWVLVNFPTPFAESSSEELAEEEGSGNSQLPRSINSDAFMANQVMLENARECLLARGGRGTLLIQSNVEDVAVSLRSMAETQGWEAVSDGSLGPHVLEPSHESKLAEGSSQWLPRRQLRHAERGGQRAVGPGWLLSSPLPPLAATETERQYMREGLPIHRVALRPLAAR